MSQQPHEDSKVGPILRALATQFNLPEGWSQDSNMVTQITRVAVTEQRLTKEEIHTYFSSKIRANLTERRHELLIGLDAIDMHLQVMSHVFQELLQEAPLEFEPAVNQAVRSLVEGDIALKHVRRLADGWKETIKKFDEVNAPPEEGGPPDEDGDMENKHEKDSPKIDGIDEEPTFQDVERSGETIT